MYVGDEDPPGLPDLNVLSLGAYFAESLGEHTTGEDDPHARFRRPDGG